MIHPQYGLESQAWMAPKLVKTAPKKACISSPVGVSKKIKTKKNKKHILFSLNYMIYPELGFGKWCTKAQSSIAQPSPPLRY